jgi:DnaJ-class molecular chaperone
MTPCPDCDSIRMFSLEPQGDGKCSACHGTGFEEPFEMLFESVLDPELTCEECQGTGQCQTCAGMGLLEEYALELVA